MSKPTPEENEAEFRDRITAFGAVMTGTYTTVQKPVDITCSAGHPTRVALRNLRNGQGICRACYLENKAARGEARFRQRVAELGGTVVGEYVSTKAKVTVRCAAGHEHNAYPGNITRKGASLCNTCVHGTRKLETFKRFRSAVESQGGTVVGEYVNSGTGVAVRCKEGHPGNPVPSNVLSGSGFCKTCVGHSADVAEGKFLVQVGKLGCTLIGSYAGAHTPVKMLCPKGHECSPTPQSIRRGQGPCSRCGHRSDEVETRFRKRVAELGGSVVGEYVNSTTPVRVQCKEGHENQPTPGYINRGGGICATCAGRIFDAFYVLHNPEAGIVKIGITSIDGIRRLREHRRDGFTEVLRTFTDLPDGEAKGLEDELLNLMKLAGVAPVRGREYFPDTVRSVVLGVVDDWLSV